MAELKIYEYGAPKSKQTLVSQLSEEDVARYRKAGFEVKEHKPTANKAAAPAANKAG